jgi:UDP-N-acetylglucosamine 4,6-dehydratase (inverting)
MSYLAGKAVLITGGTGSFGKAFVKRVLADDEIKKLVVFSRDELKQFEMAELINSPKLRYFLGDVRDYQRLLQATDGVDVIIHAAAMKQIPAAEYNPFEFIKTNIMGAQNVIEACLDQGVRRVVALSTDKAAAPINLYGATKLCSDKLFIAANNFKGERDLRFSVVRYGNVMGSRGSVIPFFLNKAKSGVLPITDNGMTRFNIPLDEGVEMVCWALEHALGGEILVPKIPSYRISDVAEAIGPNCKKEIIGIRPGEKLHEEMITSSDSPNTLDLGQYFAILGSGTVAQRQKYMAKLKAQQVGHDFSYDSSNNPEYLSVAQIRELIKLHINPEFEPA